MIGPALPPGLSRSQGTRGSGSDNGSDNGSASGEEDEAIGPAPLMEAGPSTRALGTEDAAEAFREREERMRRAREDVEAQKAKQENARPDWMVQLPEQRDIKALLADPLKLKSRGFSQNTRVQSRQGISSTSGQDSRLWTETPQEKAARLQQEAEGKLDPMATMTASSLSEQLEHAREAKRAATIEETIRKGDPSRATSLLELHQDRRRKDHTSSKRSREDSERHTSSSRSRRERRDSDEDRDRHRHSHRDHHRSRHSSGKDGDEKQRSSSHKQRERDRRKGKERDDSLNDSHRAAKHKKRREDRDAERHTREKASREAQAASKVGAWDWEAAMGAGGKMLDESAKKKAIRDAAGLGDRFGRGTSSYL